ncbi:hypothetical protein H5410_023632 [Solanum commersonii]|uniref:G-patch domain-containing protein n=1 Tax=Solanum commersonii TaxID=4109 RepID=A0A9J5ZJA3_SOLCO|nr:hypothetical protein H5410_023632 [Solanum commersonii]
MGKGSSVRGADLRNRKPIIPKNVDAKKFLELLEINQVEKESLKNRWVSLDFLYERYGQKDGFKNYRNQLSNQGGEEAWKANGCVASMVAFLGLIVFPKRNKHIDIRLAGVVKALTTMESPTIIPMILADMFCALTKCISGEMYFKGCNILLQIWFLEHLYHHDGAPRFTVDWCNYVSSHKERETKIDFPKGIIACEEKLSVITSDEIVLNIVQEIPPNDDMSRFVFDTPLGFAFDSTDILKIWFGSIISELSEMVVEQDKGKVVPGYLSWFRDPITFGDIPEGSSRKRKDQHIIRQLEKELEKAKTTIFRQEVQVQRGRNIQLELQDAEGELKHVEGKLSRLEEELDSRIHLARQIKKEQSFKISRLKRDLVASEEVVNYQRGKFKRRKEKSEKERSCWMHLHDQLKAELEEHKRKLSQCVDIEERQRQMIIERATLRHQLEATEKREALLRNNLGDHQARSQVHQLAEQTSYVIKNHRRMNDPEVAEQARAIVPHLPKVLLNLSKVRASMTSNTEIVVNPVDTPVDPTIRESTTIEENRTLRHVMAQFCGAGPSTTRPQGMPFRNNPTIAIAAPVYTLTQPTVTQRAAQEGQFTVHSEKYCFQANERCEYHSWALGHNTDNCWTLKGAIEKLIDHGVVVVTDEQNTPNVTNNPLPAQNNLVGMICDDQEYKFLGKMGKLFRKIGEENKPIKSLKPVASLSVEGVNLDTKFCVSGGFRRELKFEQDQNCLAKLKGPIFVKPVQQLPVTDSKAEIIEEVDEAGGLIRSGRCYSPEELRKGKMTQNIQVPLKKAVTEEKAEDFLKKIKEIIVHVEDDLPIYRDPSIPYIVAKEGCDSIVYQSFEAVSVDRFREGDPIIQPYLSSSSLMVATKMLKYGYQPGKGLRLCSQGIVDPITLLGNQGTSGLGYKQSKRNGDETKNHKRTDWALPQPIPHIYHSFIKPQGPEMEASFTHEDIK